MKQPRIEDFDPEAAERKLGSPLDDMPVIEKPRPQPRTSITRPTATTNGKRQEVHVVKNPRPYAPRTFNIFADQIEYLNRAWLEQRLAGQDISINDMVREALDLYIAQKSPKK